MSYASANENPFPDSALSLLLVGVNTDADGLNRFAVEAQSITFSHEDGASDMNVTLNERASQTRQSGHPQIPRRFERRCGLRPAAVLIDGFAAIFAHWDFAPMRILAQISGLQTDPSCGANPLVEDQAVEVVGNVR